MHPTLGQPFLLHLRDLPDAATALALTWLPAGAFVMGSPSAEPNRVQEEEPQFFATLSEGFWLGKCPVTQAQWQSVMGSYPRPLQELNPNCPMDNVSWHDAIKFCEELNGQFSDRLPAGYRFSLPTEVQWEYSCRAGTQTIYNVGDTLADLDRAAWHKDNSSGRPHPVGEKEPNAWGLHDMHGNTFEWCFDSPSAYPRAQATDWIGTGGGYVRSIRSSSWSTSREATDHRCACRGADIPSAKAPWFGFRLCLRVC